MIAIAKAKKVEGLRQVVVLVRDVCKGRILPNRLAERLASAKQRNRNVNCASRVWLAC